MKTCIGHRPDINIIILGPTAHSPLDHLRLLGNQDNRRGYWMEMQELKYGLENARVKSIA